MEDELPVVGREGGWETDIPSVDSLGREPGFSEGSGETSSAGRSTVGSSVVDSIKHTVKSVTGLLPASLGGDAGWAEGEGLTDSSKAVIAKTHDDEPVIEAERGEEVDAKELPQREPITGSDAQELEGGREESEMSFPDNASVESMASSRRVDDEFRDMEKVRVSETSGQAQDCASNNVSEADIHEKESRIATISPPASSSSFTSASSSSPSSPSSSGHFVDWTNFMGIGKASSSSPRKSPTSSKGSEDDSSFVTSVDPEGRLSSEESDVSYFPGKPAHLQSHIDSPAAVQVDMKGKKMLEPEVEDSPPEVKRKELELSFRQNPESDVNSASSANAERVLRKRRVPSSPTSSGVEESGSSHEVPQRREMHRVPARDTEGEEGGATQLLLLPTVFIIRAIAFQVNLIIQVVAVGVWMVGFALSALAHPVNGTVTATDRLVGATEGTVDQGSLFVTSAIDGVSRVGPAIGSFSRKTFWKCVTAAYAICFLGFLLISVIVVDFIAVNYLVEEPVKVRQVLDFDYTDPKPVAEVPLFPPAVMDKLQSLPPEKVLKIRAIPASHRFHVTVMFTIPESDYNVNLGTFQVTAELRSARDQVLLKSSRPCRLRFSSLPVRLLKTLLSAGPLVLGFFSETQKVEMRLLEAREKITPTASIRIRLEPRASYRDGGGVPDIDQATVLVESSLPWSKAILRRWRWTFYVWNGVWMFLFEVSVVLCCCRKVMFPGFVGNDFEEAIPLVEVKNERVRTENRSHRGARDRRRANVD